MTKVEYLLFCLGEECGELQQIVGKMARFGADGHHEKTGHLKNKSLLKLELHDILAVYKLIMEELGESSDIDIDFLKNKQNKVELYYNKYKEQE